MLCPEAVRIYGDRNLSVILMYSMTVNYHMFRLHRLKAIEAMFQKLALMMLVLGLTFDLK